MNTQSEYKTGNLQKTSMMRKQTPIEKHLRALQSDLQHLSMYSSIIFNQNIITTSKFEKNVYLSIF